MGVGVRAHARFTIITTLPQNIRACLLVGVREETWRCPLATPQICRCNGDPGKGKANALQENRGVTNKGVVAALGSWQT